MTPFRKKILLQGGIAAVAVIALSIGISISAGSLEVSGKEVISAREELSVRSGTLAALARLQSQYQKQAKDYIAVLNSVIPKEAELFNVSRDFQIIATQSGVKQTFAFTGETPAQDGDLGLVMFRVQAEGDLPNIQLFIQSLERFRYVMRIESFAVARTRDGANTATLRGSMYFRNISL